MSIFSSPIDSGWAALFSSLITGALGLGALIVIKILERKEKADTAKRAISAEAASIINYLNKFDHLEKVKALIELQKEGQINAFGSNFHYLPQDRPLTEVYGVFIPSLGYIPGHAQAIINFYAMVHSALEISRKIADMERSAGPRSTSFDTEHALMLHLALQYEIEDIKSFGASLVQRLTPDQISPAIQAQLIENKVSRSKLRYR